MDILKNLATNNAFLIALGSLIVATRMIKRLMHADKIFDHATDIIEEARRIYDKMKTHENEYNSYKAKIKIDHFKRMQEIDDAIRNSQ